MDVPLYLARLEYSGPLKPDAQTLQGLHRAHMLKVPFENLDIGLNRPIKLHEAALWDKIVVQKRGGFCYELNGLFAALLRELGFRVVYLNARVYNQAGELGIDFDHLALLVQSPHQSGRWLADVGFGDSFNAPLRFEEQGAQVQGLRSYRLEKSSDGYTTWRKNYHGPWERLYFFDLQPRNYPSDYQSACLYHQTSPHSSFTRGSVISRATPEGRISLEDGRLILTENGRRSEHPLENDAEYRAFLKQYFEVRLPEEQT